MKTILITGAANGLGKELALRFSFDEVRLILTDKDREGLLEVQKQVLEPRWAKCDVVSGDLGNKTTIQALYDLAYKHDLSVLINNAGVRAGGQIKNMSSTDISDMISTNLVAAINLTKAMYPVFMLRKTGLIVNINSIAGQVPNSTEAAYCASKYGMRGFFDSFRFEAREHDIFVMSVYCGAMNTRMTDHRADKGKLIDPLDVAKFVHSVCNNDFRSFYIPEVHLWRKNA